MSEALKILKQWKLRRKVNFYQTSIRELQNESRKILGLADFSVPAFDVSLRTTIINGINSLAALELIRNFLSMKENKWRFEDDAIDVGANIGQYSVYFSRYWRRTIAIEAHPKTYRVLDLNVEAIENVESHCIAISSKSGKQQLYEVGEGQSPRSTLEQGMTNNHSKIVSEVYSISIDEFVRDKDIEVGLLKIDVEGHDEEVLKGAVRTIKRFNPYIVFEFSSYNRSMIKLLCELGYTEFYAPSTEILARLKSKKETLKFIFKQPDKLSTFLALYSTPVLIKFSSESLPICDLVLAVPNNNCQDK